jgi:MerR family mercuric resistance operon transcriptional regulator
MASELTIGRVAKLAGVNVETIRYYQRRGLLAEPDKPHMGYRRYPADIVKHIRFIKRAQALGFTLRKSPNCCGWRKPAPVRRPVPWPPTRWS